MHYELPPPAHYEMIVASEKSRQESPFKIDTLKKLKQLDGWCSDFKASTLMEIVWLMRPQVIVEIGVFGGKSLVPMAFVLKDLGRGVAYGIDPWSAAASVEGSDGENKTWWENLDHKAILDKLQSKIYQFGLDDQIYLVQATSQTAPEIPNIDILHIDGNHSDESSYFDVLKWVPLVRRGGMIIFDDINWSTIERAPQWLDKNCTRMVSIKDESNEWAIWVKP